VVVEGVTVAVGVATVGAVMMAAVGADSTGTTTTDVELVSATTLVSDTDENTGHFCLMVVGYSGWWCRVSCCGGVVGIEEGGVG
jgi:hypothetical protein